MREQFEIWEIGPDESTVLASTDPTREIGARERGMRELLANPIPGQRDTSEGRIGALTRAFRRGHAYLTWDLLALDEKGRLSNFFHRGNAIVASGVTMRVGVMLNVSFEAIEVGDRGQPRSLEQRLKREGVQHPSHVATSLRYLTKMLLGMSPSERTAVGDDDVLMVRAAHPTLENHITTGRRLSVYPRAGERQNGGNLGSPGLGALLSYLFLLVDPPRAASFLASWEQQMDSGPSDPLRLLNDWLRNEARARPGAKGGADVRHKYGMVVHAFNAWPGRMHRVEYDPADPLPKIVWPQDRPWISLVDLDDFIEPPIHLDSGDGAA